VLVPPRAARRRHHRCQRRAIALQHGSPGVRGPQRLQLKGIIIIIINFVLPGERGLRRQKLMLKTNLVLERSNQCVMLLRRLLHGKHVKGSTVLHTRTCLHGTVRPMFGKVPSIGSVPSIVAR
jgi:hypothetical protein